jgi:hypothetical protein
MSSGSRSSRNDERRRRDMSEREPRTEFEPEFSEDTAQATAWGDGRKAIEQAEVYWLSTVRPDGRPHVTPLLAVWQDDALHFCTGADERKAKNLEHNPHCVLTTGNNALHGGLDIVVEGDAVRVRGTETLQRLARRMGAEVRPRVALRRRRRCLHPRGRRGARVRCRAGKGVRLRQGALQSDPLALRVRSAPRSRCQIPPAWRMVSIIRRMPSDVRCMAS